MVVVLQAKCVLQTMVHGQIVVKSVSHFGHVKAHVKQSDTELSGTLPGEFGFVAGTTFIASDFLADSAGAVSRRSDWLGLLIFNNVKSAIRDCNLVNRPHFSYRKIAAKCLEKVT